MVNAVFNNLPMTVLLRVQRKFAYNINKTGNGLRHPALVSLIFIRKQSQIRINIHH